LRKDRQDPWSPTFASFDNPEITRVGIELDGKLAAPARSRLLADTSALAGN
jgi:hypothetical protein